LPTSADLLLDTSAALALARDVDPAHERVSDAAGRRTLGLSGHALYETYSVLTRLAGSARVRPERAAEIIQSVFPASALLLAGEALQAPATFAAVGIAGGSVYDGLVGLAARAAGVALLTCDRRAAPAYAALGVEFRLF